jgi:hypothetical protein
MYAGYTSYDEKYLQWVVESIFNLLKFAYSQVTPWELPDEQVTRSAYREMKKEMRQAYTAYKSEPYAKRALNIMEKFLENEDPGVKVILIFPSFRVRGVLLFNTLARQHAGQGGAAVGLGLSVFPAHPSVLPTRSPRWLFLLPPQLGHGHLVQALAGFLVNLGVVDGLPDVGFKLLEAHFFLALIQFGLALTQFPLGPILLTVHQSVQRQPLLVLTSLHSLQPFQFIDVAEGQYRSACVGMLPVEPFAFI